MSIDMRLKYALFFFFFASVRLLHSIFMGNTFSVCLATEREKKNKNTGNFSLDLCMCFYFCMLFLSFHSCLHAALLNDVIDILHSMNFIQIAFFSHNNRERMEFKNKNAFNSFCYFQFQIFFFLFYSNR